MVLHGIVYMVLHGIALLAPVRVLVILILMKVGILTSTWFQNVPFCSLMSERFCFRSTTIPSDVRKFFGLQWEF